VDQVARVDFMLETGAVTGEVRITEAAPVVETQNSNDDQ
jgi:hypothetical protein